MDNTFKNRAECFHLLVYDESITNQEKLRNTNKRKASPFQKESTNLIGVGIFNDMGL